MEEERWTHLETGGTGLSLFSSLAREALNTITSVSTLLKLFQLAVTYENDVRAVEVHK